MLFNKVSGNGQLMTLVVGLANNVGSVFSTYFIFKFGMKPNLVLGAIGECIGMLLFLIGYKILNVPLLIVATIFYMFTYSIGLGSTQGVYISEILPASGIGAAFAMQWTWIAITGLVFPYLIFTVGPLAMIAFFCIFCALASGYMWLTCVETKDKTSDQISQEFNTSFIQVCKNKSV